jgi:uncharacterized membrane protein
VIPAPTSIGWIHAALAATGIVTGAVQLLRPKGSPIHRALGYAYVYGMIASDAAAMLLYRFTGSFNIFHAGAILNFACIVAAMIAVIQRPRAPDWMARHYRWIAGSYLGLIAAAATEFVVRVLPLGSRGQVWLATIVTTAVVMVVGTTLIRRYYPRATRSEEVSSAGIT